MKQWLVAIGVSALLFFGDKSQAQDSTRTNDSTTVTDSVVAGALNIIVDCPSCDQNYIKTEIGFVNFVRDRQLADVDILISRQTTGALGKEYTLEFIGQGNFATMRDTLKYISKESDSDDEIRKGLVKTIKLGLVRYVSRTSLGSDVNISYEKPAASTQTKDPWDHWVFSLSADGWATGQRSTSQFSVNGQIAARRTTEMLKIRLSLYTYYRENKYDFDDFKLTSISRSRQASGSIYWGLDGHWSAGVSASVYGSSYDNVKVEASGSGGIEYDVFPYKESTRRQLRLQYRLTGSYAEFNERTIYDKLHAWLPYESISANLSLIQPWGSATGSVYGSHYFHDFSKNHLSASTDLSLNLFSGFSLNGYGYISWIHDQIALPALGATQEEILLQRRELATSYNYYISFGLTYTFGSIYNTIVNPRFGN